MSVEVTHPKVAEQVRFIRRDAQGELCIWNFRFEKARGFYNVGLESLVRQVKGARALGVKRLECWAAGNPKDTRYSGYYQWARYGYDAPLTLREKMQIARFPQLAGAQTLNELMLQGGNQWWKENGTERQMTFELGQDSSMMKTLRHYLMQKHPELLPEL